MAGRDERGEEMVVLTRVFDAPRELVFAAWIEPKHFVNWWGPRGCRVPVCELDPRPGGLIHYVMRAPEFDHRVRGTFDQVTRPTRLVLSQWFVDERGNREIPIGFDGWRIDATFLTVVEFFDEPGDKTRVTVKQSVTFPSGGPARESFARVRGGAREGWSSSLDRLADLVDDTSDREIRVKRVFDAPRELVWKAWTEPEGISQWWGPKGFRTTTEVMDVRPGGEWRHVMHGPDGRDYPNLIVYEEVIAPERLLYRHPAFGGETADFRAIITFEAQGARTEVTLRMIFANAADLRHVDKKYGAIDGASQTLQRLDEHLKAQR
jgi:uncharacterized protein YndB with AHSA1/START domain